jgi:hypothetical protein
MTLCTVCADADGGGQVMAVLERYGLDVEIIEKLSAADILTIGDLARITTRHGTYWHRDVAGVGEAAADKVTLAVEAFHLARAGTHETVRPETGSGAAGTTVPPSPGPTDTGPTDQHDRVNDRNRTRLAGAPIKGTKADTSRERHSQAKADSDAAAAQAAEVLYRGVEVRVGFAGKIDASEGELRCSGQRTVSVVIGKQTLIVKADRIVIGLADGLTGKLLAALKSAGEDGSTASGGKAAKKVKGKKKRS